MKVVKMQSNEESPARKNNEIWHQIWTKVRGGWVPSRRSESNQRKGYRSILLPDGRKIRLIPLWRIGVKHYTCSASIFSPQARTYIKIKDWGKGHATWERAEYQVTLEFKDVLERVKDVVG